MLPNGSSQLTGSTTSVTESENPRVNGASRPIACLAQPFRTKRLSLVRCVKREANPDTLLSMPEWLYTRRERFTPESTPGWDAYLSFSTFKHITELVTLDSMLCPNMIEELRDEDWDHN